MSNTNGKHVIIAGGGICGLTAALTLHQIGVSCTVFESASEQKPLGVGINIQPNAVRELFDLGITRQELDSIGIEAREWALVGLNGNDIYSEDRGTLAGYHWPQYAIHRGELQMLLYRKVVERLGADAVKLGHKAVGYSKMSDGRVEVQFEDKCRDTEVSYTADVLIGADGIHSAIRAQMHPNQPSIHWGGCIMWRGVTRAPAIRSGSSFVGLGTSTRRLVIYPISQPDEQGMSLVNWIAEETYDTDDAWAKTGWFTETPVSSFIEIFEDMNYDWLDVPEMLNKCDVAFENPMIDRDPVDTWHDNAVLLLGDAAHPMYPTGSNGASQAIVDTRHLAAKFLKFGVGAQALEDFDKQFNEPINQVVLRNRGAGPFSLLNLVDERCSGLFDNIADVVSLAERDELMANYKRAAGFARDTLNAAPPIIAPGSKI